MSTRQMRYKVRAGTIDSGKKYESKVAALLSLRCVRGEEDMWISSNADKVGAFDDIILHQGNKTFMLQLKHKDGPTCLSKTDFFNQRGNFGLDKYVKDIVKLKDCIDCEGAKPEIVNYLGSFNNIYFVLFTNRGVKNCDILKALDDDTFSILSTSSEVYQVDRSDCPSEVYLLPNQIHAKDINTKIAEEIERLAEEFKIQHHHGHLGITEIAGKFTKYVKNWAEGTLGGHYCLTKHDIICKLTDLFCCQYETKIIQEKFTFYKSEKKQVWNTIMKNEVVTVVDYDEVAFKFLLEYLGSEVSKYCAESNYWKDSLSIKAQTSFYQEHAGLKTHILKVVGSRGKITLLDVYKCLWMDNQLPLLLEINKLEQYHDILHIIKFSRYNYKVVVINKSGQILPLPSSEDAIKCFRSVSDLNQENRSEILKQEVKLQGRSSITLRKLVDEDMLQHIKCKDIIKVLLEQFSIGNNLNLLPEYFIPRSVSKVFLKSKVLDETDQIFLIEETLKKRFAILPVRNSNVCRSEDLKTNTVGEHQIILTTENACCEEVEKLKSMKKSFHHLKIHNENCLEWKASFGSVANLRQFKLDLDDMVESNISNNFYSPINIISGVPGMGKSVLMDYVALQAPMDKWVLRIDLNGHLNYYKTNTTTKALDHVEYFKNALLNQRVSNIELSNAVFAKLSINKDVMVLLDGFDELPLSYKNGVTNIAKCLYGEGYWVWLTTRPHMNAHLENELDTFSITLKSFTVNNQKEFLTNYFLTSTGNVELDFKPLVENFVEKLLKAAGKNLNDKDAEFTGIPLQTKLLADVFKEDCANYVSSKGSSVFNEIFDLVYLYQNFINRKIDILCDKFGNGAQDEFVIHKDHVVFFAIKLLFPKHNSLFTYINEKLSDYNRPEKKQQLQKEGIITIDRDLEVNFTHRTFAEFLTAQWLVENLSNTKNELKNIAHILLKERFFKDYAFLFNLYDRIACKDCSMRLAILNGDINKAINIVNSQDNVISKFDKGERSILHIVALHSIQFPLMNRWLWNGSPAKEFLDSKTFTSDITLQLIEIIPEQLLFIGADSLGYTPLDYALANRSLSVAEKISAKSKPLVINVNIPLKHKIDYLAYCAKLNYRFLFYNLLTYFISRELLLKDIQPDVTLGNYFHSIFQNYDDVKEISNFKFELESQTVLELFQSEHGTHYSGWNANNLYYTDITYAISFGTLEDFNKLFLKVEVDKEDINGNTPLHYAALHGQAKIVKKLLLEGSEVNKQNINKDTPLHLAVKNNPVETKWKALLSKFKTNPKDKIIKRLVRPKNANLNLKNNNGLTPLHLAIEADKMTLPKLSATSENLFGTIHICNMYSVKLLLLNGADRNITDLEGRTALHYAAQTGCVEMLNEILSVGVDNIDALTCHHETPLFYAVAKNKIGAVRLLLDAGANVNILNGDNCSVLHSAAKHGYNDIISELLTSGARIDELDCKGETALFLSVRFNKIDTVKLLISKHANIKVVNNEGETVVNVARKKNFGAVIELLFYNKSVMIENKS